MSGTHLATMGDRGRLVVPVDLRLSAGLTEGTTVLLIDTPRGIVLLTRDQLKQLVRDDLVGLDLTAELLSERRQETAAEAEAE